MVGRLVALAVLVAPGLALAQSAAPGQAAAPAAVWTNDHARLVIQSVGPDGRVSGTYENVGPQLPCAGTVYPVTGWLDGERMSWTALRHDPRGCTPMQAFIGVIRGNELDVEFLALETQGTRAAIAKGADRYRRQ